MPIYDGVTTRKQRDAIYWMCMNPYATVPAIGEKAGISYNSLPDMLYRACKLTTRADFFMAKGYINLPDKMPYSHMKPVRQVLDVWHSNPLASMRDVAYHTGYSYSGVGMLIMRTYEYFGFTGDNVDAAQFYRLGFYEHMGWFDVARLQRDAQEQFPLVEVA